MGEVLTLSLGDAWASALPTAPAPTVVRRVEFFVPGEPKPMGSKTAFVIKGTNRAVVTDGKASKAIKSWKDSVISACVDAWGVGERMLGPVHVSLEFRMARPGGHYGTKGLRPAAPRYPAVKPDLDKLARSTLDALAVVLLADDSRVVSMWLGKVYAGPGATGALIRVEEIGT